MSKEIKDPIVCPVCGKESYKRRAYVNKARKEGKPQFCSRACANSSAAKAKSKEQNCEYCGVLFSCLPSDGRSCCSKKCARRLASQKTHDKQYREYIQRWKDGKESGAKVMGISGRIRRYLFEKYHNRCALCSWGEVHPITGKVPLEVEHRDGNCLNNLEDNLLLLCPNCHSLTPTFRALNKGNGRRTWRVPSPDLKSGGSERTGDRALLLPPE